MTAIEMAKEAFASRGAVDAWFKDAEPNFKLFEELIRKDERAACANVCKQRAANHASQICACEADDCADAIIQSGRI